MHSVRRALLVYGTLRRNGSLVALPVLLLMALLVASCTRPEPTKTSGKAISIPELLEDANGDGDPDLLYGHLRVRGRVEVEEKGMFLASAKRRIRLSRILEASAGDTVEVAGRLLRSGGYVVFVVESGHADGSVQPVGEVAGFDGKAYVGLLKSWARKAAHTSLAAASMLTRGWFAIALALLGLAVGCLAFKRRPGFVATFRRRGIFHHAAEAFLITDADLNVVDANAAALKLLARSSASGRKLASLLALPANLRADTVRETRTGGKPIEFETVIAEEPDTHVTVRLSPLVSGGRERYLCILADSTERNDREQLMKRLQQVILDEMPFEVAVISPQGQYVFASAALSGDGSPQMSPIGKTDLEICRDAGLHSEVAVRRRAHRRRTVASKQLVKFEETLVSEAGERHFIRYYTPVLNPRGDVSMVISYGLEVTEVRRLRQQLAGVGDEVERLRRMKESFLQNLSHEFRTPLSGIMGAVQILMDELSGDQRELMEIVSRNAGRLLKTLSDVLDLAELQAADVELNVTVLNVAGEVRALVDDLQKQADEKGLFLRMHTTENEIWARLDSSCFHRALGHLVQNAIKFTESGGVVVDVDAEDDQVHVRVMDSGVGVDDTSLLYDEFIQGSEGLDRQFEGLGIGLSITERLIGLMDGKITAYSEKAGGTMFSVTFPRVFAKGEEASSELPSVLILERDSDEQRIFRYLLETFCNVTFISDPDQIVDFVAEGRCGAVLLNVDMSPDLATLVRSIRAAEGTAWTILVGVSDQARGGDREQYLALGLDEYLQKPLTKKALLNALENLLAVHQPVH
ncbi:MAG TPA: PAS domain-containing protein [Rhodothermales bacterium]|nr:PAS domain-containing protein [Rhodothermales bacterium]